MRIHRFLSITDLVVAAIVAVAIFLPKRPLEVVPAHRLEAADRADLGFAEARALAHPDDGHAAAVLTRELGRAGYKDWAVEVALEAAAELPEPQRWRAMQAAAIAYADRVDVVRAHQWALDARSACEAAGEAACPVGEHSKLMLYAEYLDAGIRSGIDPRKNPRAFREAAQGAQRGINLGP